MSRGRSISDDQFLVHVFTEALAVGVFAPWLLAQSANPALSERDRAIAFTMGLSTIIVDGWLLARNLDKMGMR